MPPTPLERLLAEIKDAFDSMYAVIDAVVKVSNSLQNYLSKETIAWVDKQMKRFKKVVADFAKKVYEVLRMIGDSEHIRAVSEAWSGTVGKSLRKIRRDKEGEIAVHFAGQAATAYLVIEKNQRTALSDFEGSAKKVGAELDKIANEIDSFHENLIIAFATCAVAMIAGQAAILSVIGAPAGVSVSGVALTSLVLTFAGLVLDLESDLKEGYKAVDAIDPGKWPSVTSSVDLSDGSVSDGNRSGWKFND